MAIQQNEVLAARDAIARLTRQQAALAELGPALLSRVDLGLLVGQTCAMVEWALGASRVRIVQASDDGDLPQDVPADVSIPIPGNPRPFGLLAVSSESDRTYAADEVDFLRAVADLTGAVILSAATEDARRHAEERFRALVENSAEGIALIDAHGQFLCSTARVKG